MNNYIQPGHVMDYDNSATGAADIASGDVVEFADRIGVAGVDIDIGEIGAVSVVGVFELPKGNANLTQGQPVYWKDGAIVSSDASAIPAGYVFVAAPAAEVTVGVKIG